MICPYCGSNTKDGGKFCEECGRALPIDSDMRQKRADMLTDSGSAVFAIGQAARRARLNADYSEAEIIPLHTYNAIIAGVLLWGVIVNAVLCSVVGDVYRYINPILFLVGYLVCSTAGVFIAGRSASPLISFIAYNMVVVPFGLVISSLVEFYGGIDSELVRLAFVYTALITAGMFGAALAFPELFSKLGGALLGCLMGLVLCEIVLLILRVDQNITDWLASALFSLYIAYDIYRSQQFEKTVDNAVDCALDIYLDIANLFIRLLRILARSKNRRD